MKTFICNPATGRCAFPDSAVLNGDRGLTLLRLQWSNTDEFRSHCVPSPFPFWDQPREVTPTRPKVQLYLACGLFCLVSAPHLPAQADLPGSLVHPARVLTLIEGREEYQLGLHLEILEDPGGQLTIDDVTSPAWSSAFVASHDELPTPGFTRSAIWVRFRVRSNTSQASEWDLELSFPRLGQVALFQLSNAPDKRTPWPRREAGAEIPVPQWEIARRLPTFRLLLPRQEEHSIYLRIASRTAIQLPLTLRSLSNAVHTAELQSLGWGFFYGMLLLTTACFLFLYFSFWDRSYLYFASVIGCYCLFQSTVDGWNFKYVWPESPWLNEVGRLGALMAFFPSNVLFTQSFLETRLQTPGLHRAMTFLAWGLALALACNSAIGLPEIVWAVLMPVLLSLVLATSLVRWRQGYRPARFFLVSWFLLLATITTYILMCLRLLPPTWLLTDALVYGWLGVVILSSAALADRIRLLRKETEQVQTSQRESEQKLRGIFDHAFQFIGLLKPDGRIVDANQSALDFAGVSESAVIGEFFWHTPWWSHSPAEQERLRDAVERAAQGQFVRYETTHPGPDGILRSIDFSLKPVRDERGQVVMLIPEGRDITNIKQTEAALHETQERYARLAEAAFDGIGVFEDGVLVEANERFAKMMGYEMPEMLGKRNLDLAAPESADLIVNQQRLSGEIFYELVCKRKDGSKFPAEVHGVQVPAREKFVRVAAVRDITERKQAEQALRDSERHFQRLAQATFEGICVTENGVILDANEQLAHMGGYELSELLGRPAIEFVAPQSREAVQWNVLHGDGKPYEILAIRQDGSTYPVEVRGHEEFSGGRTLRITALRDLTLHKQAEEALRESEERFRLVAERTGQMIYDLDILSGRVQWAGAVPQVSGYSLEEFQQIDLKAWEEHIHPEDREKAILLLEKTMATGQPYDVEYRFRRKDGNYIIVEDNGVFLKEDQGQSVRMLGTMNDVTERRKAQDLILRVGRSIGAHTGQSFLRSLVTHLSQALDVDYAFVGELKRNLPGRVQTVAVLANGQVVENFEYDLVHTPCENVMNGAVCSYPRQVQKAFPLDDLLREMKVDGYVGTPLLDSTGTTKGLMVVLSSKPILNVDLAESVLQIFAARAAAELERLEAEARIRGLNAGLEQRVKERTVQLEYANRELESFSYSVSHDLSAPLRNISGFVELLQKRVNGSLDEKAERYLETINDEARRMGTLIESLLDFSKLSRAELQKTAVDLNRLVAEVRQQFLFEIQDRSIEWHIEPLPVVLGDWNLLKQVFTNFLSNAIKYTRTRSHAQITIGCQRGSSEEVVVFVRDNGVGFNMKHASKLFGVFQRLHSVKEFEGTGIGLANAQRIIHRHRGRVWAEAEEERGATFFFTLPT